MLFVKGNRTMRTDTRIRGGGWLLVSSELERDVLALLPYVKYTLDGDVITAVEDDVEARNAPASAPIPTEAEKLRADVDFILASLGETIEPEKIEAYRDAGLWTAERVQVAEELAVKEVEIGGRG